MSPYTPIHIPYTPVHIPIQAYSYPHTCLFVPPYTPVHSSYPMLIYINISFR